MTATVILTDTFGNFKDKTNELIAMTQAAGMATGNPIKLQDTTQSTSNTTGSIITAGGVGIAKDVTIGGSVNVHGNLHANGNITSDGSLTFGDTDTDNVVFAADINSHIIPNTDDTYDLGSSTQEWRNLYIDGTATIDVIQADETITVSGTTQSTSNTSGSIVTAGGVGIAKNVTIGGSVNVHGNLHANGNITSDGSLTFGDTDTDNIVLNADVNSDIIPNINVSFSLGNTTQAWANTYTKELILDGGQVTSSATEINYNDISALGTAEVSKVVTSSATGDVTFVDSTNDIDIASHDGTNGLKLGGTLVTSSAIEINYNDISALGTAEVSKVVTSSATGDVTFVDSTNDIDIASHDGTNGLKLGGVLLTSTASDLNTVGALSSLLSGLTADAAELNVLDGVIAGTVTASKALVVDGNKDLDTLRDVSMRDLTLSGNLSVSGTTTTINTATLEVEDINIELGKVATPSDTTADGGGITLKGATDKTILWTNSLDSWVYNQGITVGVAGTGHDVTFYGDTSGKHLLWDQSGDELLFATSTKLSFHDAAGGENILASSDGHLEVNAGTTLDITAPTVDINASVLVQIDGAVSVGVNDTGHDVKFFGATSGAYAEWDESADELELRGGAATPGKLLLSTAETTVVDGNKLGQIDFQAPLDSAGTDAILVGASIWAEADATFSSSINSTDLVFATGNSETATEKMRIDSTGQVTFADGAVDVDIASHDGSNGLKLGGTLITTSAADLNNSATTGKAIAMAIVFGG